VYPDGMGAAKQAQIERDERGMKYVCWACSGNGWVARDVRCLECQGTGLSAEARKPRQR